MSGVFPGTFIPTGVGSSPAFSSIVDNLMTPRLMAFRMIHIADEPCELMPDFVTWRVSYGNWLVGSNIVIRKGGMIQSLTSQITNIDYVRGTFQAGIPDLDGQKVSRDTLEATYVWDYFPQPVLEGFLMAAISIVNMTSRSPVHVRRGDLAPPAPFGGVA